MQLEQRVEELEKELALLKAKNKLQETNLKISYSDGNKFNFKEAMENIKTDFNITLDDYNFMEASVKYPEIVGSWDDLPYSSAVEKKIEKNLGKIVAKFKILHHEWEMDGYGYIIYDQGEKQLVISDHGTIRIVDKEHLNELIKNYKEVIQETEKALSLIKMNDWVKILIDKSLETQAIKESEILINIPFKLRNEWDNFMRGKTCPILDDGDHGVYSWDLVQFLQKYK